MRQPRSSTRRPPSHRELVQRQALARCQSEREKWTNTRRPPTTRRPRRPPKEPDDKTLVKRWGLAAWQAQWDKTVEALPQRRAATAWLAPWSQDLRKLYAGLSKAEATALFLLRTEVIGLNAWLTTIQVPGAIRACHCGWQAQTVRHILLHCPRFNRAELIIQCGSKNLGEILSRPNRAQPAARWFIRSGVLEQFRTAKEIEEEDRSRFRAFTEARWW